eukprot:gene10330-7224_t
MCPTQDVENCSAETHSTSSSHSPISVRRHAHRQNHTNELAAAADDDEEEEEDSVT